MLSRLTKRRHAPPEAVGEVRDRPVAGTLDRHNPAVEVVVFVPRMFLSFRFMDISPLPLDPSNTALTRIIHHDPWQGLDGTPEAVLS